MLIVFLFGDRLGGFARWRPERNGGDIPIPERSAALARAAATDSNSFLLRISLSAVRP